jgi:metallo-beta-lactamase family protein
MKISFHGAARTVTGSKHLLHLHNGKKLLLDCGMFQGLGKETLAMNGHWGFNPKEVTVVVLSHAHVDHCGLLPKLVKDGFKGKIWCTPPTAQLAKLLLHDSARIQESDIRFVNKKRLLEGKKLIEPLYTEDDVMKMLPQLTVLNYDEETKIEEGISLLFTDCGHILGSAAVNLKIENGKEKIRLTFSGDVGRYRDLILRSPEPFPQADVIMMESTYGNSLHDLNTIAAEKLLNHIVTTCLKHKGKLIIPAFSLGRTQELLFLLNRLELEKRLPPLKYHVDSPLSIHLTEIIKSHPECFNKAVQKLLKQDDDVFSFKGLNFILEASESKRLNESKEPCVIISASGMAEAGRVKHHIKHNIGDTRNTILIVGYCEPHSLGGRLRNGARSVSIFGEPMEVRANIAVMNSLSAHGDYEDICQWLSCQDAQQVQKFILVHGEYENQLPFRERLLRKGFHDVVIPELGEEIGFNIE